MSEPREELLRRMFGISPRQCWFPPLTPNLSATDAAAYELFLPAGYTRARSGQRRFSVIIQDSDKPFFRITDASTAGAYVVLTQGSVGDTFEAAVAVVKQLYDAVLEGRIT